MDDRPYLLHQRWNRAKNDIKSCDLHSSIRLDYLCRHETASLFMNVLGEKDLTSDEISFEAERDERKHSLAAEEARSEAFQILMFTHIFPLFVMLKYKLKLVSKGWILCCMQC